MRGVGGGVGGPPLRDHLWQGPPLPVTLRLIHPPPKMTQGGNDPLTPLHRLSTASLSGVVRAFAYHRYFRFFLSLFFSTPLNEFFQIQAYLITDFDCWLCFTSFDPVGYAIFATYCSCFAHARALLYELLTRSQRAHISIHQQIRAFSMPHLRLMRQQEGQQADSDHLA